MLEWRVLAPGTEDRNRGRHSSRKQVGGSVPSWQWGGGSATGERPTGLPGRWGLAHQASGRRVRAPLARTSPHAGTSRIREAAAGACGSGSGSNGSRSLSTGDTAASGLARMAGPTHALPFAPRRPVPQAASRHTGSQTGAQAGTSEPRPSFKTPTRRMKCPQLGAARGDARQPPPQPPTSHRRLRAA